MFLIEVKGTIDDPKPVRKAFPELAETLQQLFPEAASNESRAPKLPSLRDVFPVNAGGN